MEAAMSADNPSRAAAMKAFVDLGSCPDTNVSWSTILRMGAQQTGDRRLNLVADALDGVANVGGRPGEDDAAYLAMVRAGHSAASTARWAHPNDPKAQAALARRLQRKAK
jgi:hypothetical protein